MQTCGQSKQPHPARQLLHIFKPLVTGRQATCCWLLCIIWDNHQSQCDDAGSAEVTLDQSPTTQQAKAASQPHQQQNSTQLGLLHSVEKYPLASVEVSSASQCQQGKKKAQKVTQRKQGGKLFRGTESCFHFTLLYFSVWDFILACFSAEQCIPPYSLP